MAFTRITWVYQRIHRRQTCLFVGLLAPLGVLAASAANPTPQADETSRSWNRPVDPFRILGNLYYVGASDITSYLIVTPAGAFLLDGGFVETAPQIEANIRKLGFQLSDVKILLNSHEHFDHAGGLAELKRATGASLVASPEAARLLESGGRGDFYFHDSEPFPAVKPDRLVHDGEAVTLGGMALTAHLTPGHTRGCTTWTTTLEDQGARVQVVFFCSTTVISGYRLAGTESYPGIAADFEHTFAVLRSLPCDLFLAPHGSMFDLTEKRNRLAAGAKPNPFIDPQSYRAYLDHSESAFRERYHQQQEAIQPSHPR